MEGDTFITVVDWFSSFYKDEFITEKIKHGESDQTRYNIYEIDIDPATIETVNRIKQKSKNIIPLCGDSPQMLRKLIDENTFQPSDSCLFYLDAHTVGVSEPMAQELEQICRLEFPVIIGIDDWDVVSLRHRGYSDMYGIGNIYGHIRDRTDVIYETIIPNIHSKQTCLVFMGYNRMQLSPILRHLPLIETSI
jgi:hypothetical protein